MIKDFKIFESIKISKYKDYSKPIDWEFYNKMKDFFADNFDDLSRNGYRAYFKIKIDKDKINPPNEILDWLNWNGYYVMDYKNGTCMNKNGKTIRIGKVLNNHKRDDLLKIYSSDPNREITEDEYLVVLSCHPYDIIGMSTNRRWSSCLDLDDKRYNKDHLYYLERVVKKNHIVAYLTKINDRNINDPLSRLLIITPGIKNDKGLIVDFLLYLDNNIYGLNLTDFRSFLFKLTDGLNYKIKEKYSHLIYKHGFYIEMNK